MSETSIETELRLLQSQSPNGLLQPEFVVQWAANHKQSALYSALEWDDAKAGAEYRLEQVRRLIRIHVRNVEGKRELISLTIDRINPGGGYRQLDMVMRDHSLRAIALTDALAELDRVQAKYQWLTELASVWAAVDKVRTRHVPAGEAERSVAEAKKQRPAKQAKRSRA
jgi:hypothetical protein